MMVTRSVPPFRADHVGSLLRPPQLLEARRLFAEGKISGEGLKGAEDSAIRDVVAMQHDVGLRSATDGEFRRSSWHMDFIYQLGGITRAEEELRVHFRNAEGTLEFTSAGLVVSDRITVDDTIFAGAFEFLKTVTSDDQVPKFTIPSPSMVHYRGGPASIDPKIYPDVEEFWADLSAAYAEEIRRLGELGCTYLQLDDTSLAYLNDPDQRRMLAGRGDDAEHQHVRYVKQINAALKGKPEGMSITTHSCRGNYQSYWVAEGGYDFVAEVVFNELDVDGFFLEYDDSRSGDFKPLRFVPPGKVVVLGLVTTKRGELESKDDLKRRIDDASQYVPVDQLCLSPQCGFSSTVEGNRLTYDQEVAKLRLIVETAQEVWG
jgi:5-methyltetrahydropteroyltriglutamate--homocysteine methyltransferase